jgi:hypothetical protein
MNGIPARYERGRAGADVNAPAARPGARNHDEWVLDEALEESFPASDSPNPVRAGSTMSRRYAGYEHARSAHRYALATAIILGVAVGALLMSRTRVRRRSLKDLVRLR